ncbi:MAG: helix-turn-helix domain-containing protein [Candidatus Sericytochromatia bacterium]|nr:helix-turn-helix domain-containing protein [Candidatus Tanganyikabacteria bacterium]
MDGINAMPTYLTTRDVARRLHVRKATVERWCRSGDLAAAFVGRQYLIDPADLARFVRERRGR